MKIAVLGAGAMGSLFGGHLVEAGNEVAFLDVWREQVDALNSGGLRFDGISGETRSLPVHATHATIDPAEVGPVDLVLVFVKCYHTEEAVRSAAALLGPETAVLTLQNGWGNAPRIARIVGEDRVMAGITYHSATLLGPGHIKHAGQGTTWVGELDGRESDRLDRVVEAFNAAGLEAAATENVLKEIWQKLALNACTLPTAALLRFTAGELVEHEGTLDLMQSLLKEVVAVANAQRIPLDFDERWEAITGLLKRAAGAKASMLQDVEKRRRTEIDVINGAIVEAGQRLNLPTPHNDTMLWMVKALEDTF